MSDLLVAMNKCIIIGSGRDVVGRRLGSFIDAGRFGSVVRVNKPYGSAVDVGGRMDVLVTRWQAWVNKYFPGPTIGCKMVFLNEHIGFTQEEHRCACEEVGWDNVSAGTLAAIWALNRGAGEVFALGFGYHPARGWPAEKRYPDGTLDTNPHYNWAAENRWLEKNVTLL